MAGPSVSSRQCLLEHRRARAALRKDICTIPLSCLGAFAQRTWRLGLFLAYSLWLGMPWPLAM